MKRLAILLILAFVFVNSTWSSGQDTTEISLGKNQVLTVTESDNNTNVTIGGNRFEVSAADQSVKIRMGKRGLEILDGPGGPELDWKKYDDYYYDDDDDADERRRDRRRYTPHWAGFEMGINNFLTSDYSMSLPAELSYMDLNTGKSFNVNINFAQLGIGLSRHFGIATGLGLEFND